jgi:hypothetical protein
MILQLILAKTFSDVSMETSTKEIAINPFTTLKPLNEITFSVKKKIAVAN